jgi:FkbM family methyltransferase
MPVREYYLGAKRAVSVLRGKQIWHRPEVRCPIMALGNPGAQWTVNPDSLSESSTVYSFGVGEDISFDLELIRRFGTTVHAFDPTPRSIKWLRAQPVPEKFVLHAYGISDFDGYARFFPPENPLYVSHSMVHCNGPIDCLRVPVHRLSTIMQKLGHQRVDLLKMDIEGAEYAVLNDLLGSRVRVRQLLVEFHHRWREIGLHKTRDTVSTLNQAGYEIFHISQNGEEYSFIDRGDHFSGVSEHASKETQ